MTRKTLSIDGQANGTAAPLSHKYVAFLAMRLAAYAQRSEAAEPPSELEVRRLDLPRYRVADAIAYSIDKVPLLRTLVAAATRFCAGRLASGR